MGSKRNICVIGCGVSGLTTALLLEQKGWDVTIISKADPRKAQADPAFASLYPAASVIPHSVSSEGLDALFINSQNHFQKLFNEGFPGLNIHQHFELFATETSLPSYAGLMREFENFPTFRNSFHPSHPTIQIESGWRFNCFFVDWSLYFPALIDKVLGKNIRLEIRELEPEDISTLPFQCVINCSGLGAVELMNDPNQLIHRGHLLRVPGKAKLTNPDGQLISYNFSPGKEIYKSENGNLQDVYFYPRSDGWVFGGSRQEGQLDENGNWTGEQSLQPTVTIENLEVPKQILDLNGEIIEHTFGFNKFDGLSELKAKVGYRYIRKKEDGLRLEAEVIHGKLFIHNYGHGGAGVTLSWSCAMEAVKLLEENLN